MNIKILYELYQEENGGTFSSNGKIYDINIIFKLSESLPVLQCNISDIDWILKYDNPSIENRNDIDYNIPILVCYDNDLLLVVDGVHRLKKAKIEGKEVMSVKFIDSSDMTKALINEE